MTMQGVERTGLASAGRVRTASRTAFSKTAFWVFAEESVPQTCCKKQRTSKRRAKGYPEDKENGMHRMLTAVASAGRRR